MHSSAVQRSLLSLVLLVFACFGGVAFAQTAEYDVKPEPVKTPPPSYPASLKGSGHAGIVAVKMTIDEEGNVASAVATKSNHVAFEPPAVEAALTWKFKPATKDGKPVAVQLVIPVRFAAE
jgi:periplasmic protein TonB